MLTLGEVFDWFERIGCCSFSTVDEAGTPHSRIAHFVAADEDGLYLTTMTVKPFYRQMKASGKLSACGEVNEGGVSWGDDEEPHFHPGVTLRVTGEVCELGIEEVMAKAEDDPRFAFVLRDIEHYPATVAFVMSRGHGELYSYDFECERRDHKLERERFAWGGDTFVEPGLVIDPGTCIGCSACADACTFKAIEPGHPAPFRILGNRCDECGSCYLACPVGAISWRSA